MRSLIAPLFLACLVFMGVSGCPPQGACVEPIDGPLMAGQWGGNHWLFQVGSDGTTYVETDCAHGTTTEPVLVYGGTMTFTVDMASEGGPQQVPPEPVNTYSATLTGTVCGDTIEFTYAGEDFSLESEVIYGEQPVLYKCL